MLQERYVTRRRMFDWVEPSVVIRDVRGGPDLCCTYAIHSPDQQFRVDGGPPPLEEMFHCSMRNFAERGASDILLHDGTAVGSLHRDPGPTLYDPVWTVMGVDGAPAARLRERTPQRAIVRRTFRLATWVPQAYDMQTADGLVFASFEEAFSPASYRLRVSVETAGRAAVDGIREVWVLTVACMLAGLEGRPFLATTSWLKDVARGAHGWELFRGPHGEGKTR
jgi:hypothetical protein